MKRGIIFWIYRSKLINCKRQQKLSSQCTQFTSQSLQVLNLKSLFLTPSRECRSSCTIARILNNELRILSPGIKNDSSIRSGDGKAKDNRSTLLPKHKSEWKILSSLQSISRTGTVGRRIAAHCLGVKVVQTIASDCVVSKVQEGDIVDLGGGEGVVAVDLSEDVPAMVEDEIASGDILRGAVQVDVRAGGFVDTADLGGGATVVGSICPVE